MFQLRDFASIILGMVNRAKATQSKITDFRVGSVARTMLEAPAAEIDELYQQMWIGLKEAIPVAIYNSFNFIRAPAVAANGQVRVTITSSGTATVIPAGTLFSPASSSAKFVSQSDVTIAAGNTYGDVFVVAQAAGVESNIGAGLSFSLSPVPPGFVSATNSAAFSNGANEEQDDQMKWRFAEYIASLNHGTNAALKYGLRLSNLTSGGMITEYVKFSSVYEPYLHDANQPVAWVRCFIHNGTTGASAELITRARNVIAGYYEPDGTPVPGWKAAGVKVDVDAATNLPVNISATLTALPGFDSSVVAQEVSSYISAYLSELDIAEPAIRSELIAVAMNVDGVYNFVMTSPAADTTAQYYQKIVPGTTSIVIA